MKNILFAFITILIVFGVVFTLVASGKDDQKSLGNENKTTTDSQNKEDSKVQGTKQYSQPPAVLPENERVGKKAKLSTNQGVFTIGLYGDKTPKTVSNFIFLAKDGFYNNVTFHRVIDGFMIQGGDPEGTGRGGPGYQFEDEVNNGLTFSKPGLLAMANAGPGTNGSQFFITVSTPTYLNNKHTIFGEVIEGYDVVERISKVQKDSSDKPLTPVVIEKIEII